MIKNGLTIVLALVASFVIAQSDSTNNAFSLARAQQYALENAYNIQLAKLDVYRTIKKKKEITAMGLPQVNAEGSFRNFAQIPTQVIPNFVEPAIISTLVGSGQLPVSALDQPLNQPFIESQFVTTFNTSLGVSASQLLFDGSYLVGLKVAKEYVGFYQQLEEQTNIETKDAVATAYNTVLVAYENKTVLEKSLKNLQKTLLETKAMYTAGFVQEQDVDQLQITISSLENSIKAAENQAIMSEKLMKLQMGMDVSESIILTDKLEDIVESLNYEDLSTQNFTVGKHIDYRILQSNQELMRMSWKMEKGANLPSLTAFLSHSQSNQVNEINFETWFPSTVLGVNLSVPIFASGHRMYKAQIAQIDYEKVGIQLTQVEQALQMQSSIAKLELQTAFDTYQTQKKNLALTEKIQQNTVIRYKEGIASSIELTQVQNQYLQTQGNYISSIFQLLNAKTKLDKAHNNY